MIPERQIRRIGSPIRSPSPVRNANRSPAPFSSRKITSITVNSLSRPGTPSDRCDSRIEVITPDVHYYEPSHRYTPDLPSRPLVQAPTNYSDFVRTTPPAGQPGPMPNTDVKVTKLFRKTANSPGPERKISSGSYDGRISTTSYDGRTSRRRRAPPKDDPQNIMIASIANFDEPRQYASVKPPNKHLGIQTDDGYTGSDMEFPGEFSILIQADLNPSSSRASHRISDKGNVHVDISETDISQIDMNRERATPDSLPPSTPPFAHSDRFTITSPPPPPTPVLPRRRVTAANDADRIIRENESLLELFPPLPQAVIEEKYTKVGDELANSHQTSPKVPRKPKIDANVTLQMKLRAQQNSNELHRQKSPMLNPQVFTPSARPFGISDTPTFSDAAESHLSHSILSDAKTTETGDETEMESVKVLDDDLDSLAAVSVYQESDTNTHNEHQSPGWHVQYIFSYLYII